ncbi:MAG TPA: ABC transporter substrate-binding protein [Steroidobacteraceae bacterium]|nr:ABC transporter substrate-binding protein [Steroidobacteraceae bacterium]
MSAREALGEVENALLDELLAGRIDRRLFLRHATRLGLSWPLIRALGAGGGFGAETASGAASGSATGSAERTTLGAAGGTIRAGVAMPHGAIDPLRVNDSGSYQLLFQVAEFLCVTRPDLTLEPVLAQSWSHNEDGSVWTFKLRRDVKFHDGREMRAEDVVASFDRLSDPTGTSNALSVFRGLLSKGGTRKVDDYTVAFHLDAPNGNFPYAVSIDNYNAVILPASYRGNYESAFMGTGPFRIESYRPREGATFVRNPEYWGPKALADRVELKFYADIQPRLIALQAGEVDLLDAVPVVMSPALSANPDIKILPVRSASHRQLHMRCDTGPFADKRVRQALALCLDRKKLLAGLCRGRGALGNDSPFAPLFPSTDPTVPQRDQDIGKARALMAAAGVAAGFDITLTTERYTDIPEYAQLVQNFAKAIDIRIELKVETQALYYGKSLPGQSDWLDSPLGITDYAHRGVPNTLLGNPLLSSGPWNSAHFKSASYDALVARYVKALDLEAQRRAAHDIQTLLLEETPLIISYFPDLLVPVRRDITGLDPIAAGLKLDRVSRSLSRS